MGKKKANGEGSISKRTDGRYMGRYTVNGKRKAVYGTTHEEARQKLNEKLNQISKGTYIEPGKDTVASWLWEWLVTYAFPTVKQSTYVSYEGYVRIHLIPELGDVKLTALTREQLQRFFNKKYAGSKKKKGLAPKTLKNIYNMLNEALEQAIINERLYRNLLHGVKLPQKEKEDIPILEPEEQTVLQAAAEESPDIQAFGIIFCLSTGVRLGELIGLRWSDLNYRNHTIHIARTVGRLKKVDEDGNVVQKAEGVKTTEIVVRPPKSDSSLRTIPLFIELWDGLMEYQKKQQALMDAFGEDYDDQGYIFCNSMGNVYDPRVYQDLFKRTLKAANLKKIKFHALRHTFATRALEAGMDIKVLSSILGHAQASTTLNLYGHALPNHKKASMDKMSGYYTASFDTNNSTDKAS